MLQIMAASKTPTTSPKPLAQKRMALPDSPSQGWVADQISDRIGETVGQQAVSYWENGRVDLKNVHPRRLTAYAAVLRISIEELAEAAGYTVNELFPDIAPAPADDISPRSSLPTVNEPPRARPLPQGLQDAIDQFGAQRRYADLNDPKWQQYLAGFQWRDGVPDDPNAWLDLYRDLNRAGVVPGES